MKKERTEFPHKYNDDVKSQGLSALTEREETIQLP